MQLITFFGLWFAFMLLYSLFLAGFFPAISGGYTIAQMEDTKVWADPSFVRGLKIVQLLYTLVSFMVPALVFAYLAHPRPAVYMGLSARPKYLQLALAILVILCALPLVNVLGEWNSTWPVSKQMRDLEELATKQTKLLLNMPDIGSMLFNLLLLALLPAIAEEVFFRGVLQRVLTPMVKNGWVAAIIAAVIFSAIHMQFLGFMPRLLLGFLMGAIYFVTGNLWLAIAGHFVNNGLQVVLVYLYQAKVISYDATQDEHVPAVYGALSALVAGILIWRLYMKAREAGQTFELPAEPGDEEEENEENKQDHSNI
ncbi:CPBP family intramembrane glutamic endopeptidase [Chitinophaga lutea]|nr:CPBP family intramembrane glutamic endopeptidase [Chitinophaga lutea]